MHKVVKRFFDLEAQHAYSVGDTFPHDGASVSEDRIEELKSDKNRLGVPLIAEIKAKTRRTLKKQNKR